MKRSRELPTWEITAFVVLLGVVTALLLVDPVGWGDPGSIITGASVAGLVRLLVVLIPASIVLTALHEAAHAIVGRLTGWQVFGVTLGHGRRVASVELGSVRVELRGALVGGATFSNATGQRWRDVAMLVAGVTVEAIAIVLALAWQPGSAWGESARWAIILVACTDIGVNLVPRRVDIGPLAGLATDGAQLLSIVTTPSEWRHDVDAYRLTAARARVVQTLQGGDLDEAVTLAAADHAADGTDRESAVLFGTLLLLSGRWRDAFDQLAPWADASDADHMTVNNAAWAAVMTFDPSVLPLADRWSERALLERPDEPAHASTRGSTLVLLGRAAEGRRLLDAAGADRITRQQRAYVLAFTALAEHRSGRFEVADEHLSRSRSLDADCPAIPQIERLMRAGAEAARPATPWPPPHPASRIDAAG